MPEEIQWKNIKQKGDVPSARSGHTLTAISSHQYLLYGGIMNAKNGKIAPDGQIYTMRLSNNEATWQKEESQGDEKPLARTQHVALLLPTQDKVFMFGGHHSPQARLNDHWFLNVKDFEWERIGGDKGGLDNKGSSDGAPDPRANSAACIYDKKVWLYGGHGGQNYSRIAFNDLFTFCLEERKWEKIVPLNNSPDGRGGHSVFANDGKIYIYGGWNSLQQYNNIVVFDIAKKEWTDPDIYNEIPRWNHSSCLVEAIPSWKFFIFGGECLEYNEGAERSFGQYVNSSCILDMSNVQWQTFASDAKDFAGIPDPREYSAMTYDKKSSRLVIFGGWNNGWYNDLHTLNVQKIVGPDYAVTSIDPPLGQLTGGVTVRITGQGFRDAGIRVLFTQGNKPVDTVNNRVTIESQGQHVSDTEVTCITPNFEAFGPKEAVIQLAISTEEITTTWCNFNYFLNTRAHKSLAYGAGLLNDVCKGCPVEFVIQARNDLGENRASGRDKFEVCVKRKIPKSGEEGDEEKEKYDEIPCEVIDSNDGQYHCKYQSDEEGPVEIHIMFEDDKGKMVPIRGSPYSASFVEKAKQSDNLMTGGLMAKYIQSELTKMTSTMQETKKETATKDKDLKDVKALLKIKEIVEHTFKNADNITLQIDQLDESLRLFQSVKQAKDSQIKNLAKLNKEWNELKKITKETKKEIAPLVSMENDTNTHLIKKLEEDITLFIQEMKKRQFFKYDCGVETALDKLNGVFGELTVFEDKIKDLGDNATKFGNPDLINKAVKDIESIKITVDNMKKLWDHIESCQKTFNTYMMTKWVETNPLIMEEEVKKLMKSLKEMKVDRKCNAYGGILEEIKKWQNLLPLIGELADPSMRDRHWDSLREKVGVQFIIDENFLLKNMYDLQLDKYQEDVEEITDQAKQEAKMEKTLAKLEEIWKDVLFEFQPHKDSGVQMIKLSEENFDMLEENQVSVTAMLSSRYLATFEDKINYWQQSLAAISEVVLLVNEVQRSWSFLENLFIHSEEVKKELPEQSEIFIDIDKEVRNILADGYKHQKALDFSIQKYLLPGLEKVQADLNICQKALNEFMDSKRTAFPRFYFVSPDDLLDILSNGNNPSKVMIHMPKIISAIDTLKLEESGVRPYVLGMKSCVGVEYVDFTSDLSLLGKVETYLQDIIDIMRSSLKEIGMRALKSFYEMDKKSWLEQYPAQICLLINLCAWVIQIEECFTKMANDPNQMKAAYDKQMDILKALILMVQGDLSKASRQKIMCLITMDAHSRDVINTLNREGVVKADEFQWQSQLKGLYDEEKKDFVFKIADAVLSYGYEYLGNGPRLVVTALTDRIYVTATQALHLKMGCAPAGPAGTGKTESTKDLASALGKACYVFNCSDQMDFRTMAGIFKGLAASGSWGCFDEFNRLIPEVLSVCSVQFKSVTDAIRAGMKRFKIQGDEISLDPSCGAFITMNPGYLGRSELPEGLKALFRPITVVVPDLELICDNMLMAEGFVNAKELAKKFTTLYFLCRDLLSKADHYDWGLRAIKSVLVVAGGFKRSEPELQEDALLMRALRDFNIPKITADDEPIFHGLLGDLFPGINPVRKVDERFEDIIKKVTVDAKLDPDPEFILKVVQLGELLAIRHCVFTMGPPGAGKSSTWKMLGKAQDKDGKKTTIVDLNPKVTSTNELYGVVLLATREWKDGLLSKKMRELGQIPDSNPKWIILDGDLDANWIESMNSVMDDNKLLTLASNERIPLKPHMKMIFEIRDLKFATPATVSRAGILFISDTQGTQWRSYYKSWITKMSFDAETKKELHKLFEKYLPLTLKQCAKFFKHVVPQVQISMVECICKLLENIMNNNTIKSIEYVFVFACVWGIGGGFTMKDGKDFKKEFSNWWKDQFNKTMKIFPSKGTVFDYYYDFDNNKLEDWNKMQTSDIESTIDTSKSIANYTIPTVDTISAQYLMRQFVQINHCSILVGMAGCGKTQIIKGMLNDLVQTGDQYLQQIINFNYYTDANLLQMQMEQQLEKKVGKIFAPVGKFKMLYFVDDLNMPARDPYNTQNAIALLRQHRDYEHWYDKNKLTQKDIQNTLLLAAMNPTAGSFVINPRLQRHFWLLAVGFPEQTSLNVIYSAYLTKHFSHNKFKVTILDQTSAVIKATLSLHGDVVNNFRKNAQNFHYEFNVRHLTNVFQGILTARVEAIKEPDMLIKLWIHEAERIYGDRLVDAKDLATYRALAAELVSKSFSKFNLKKFFGPTPEPLIFASFVGSLEDKLYDQFQGSEALQTRLSEGLREYNDVNAVMDLVLFEDAMKHVCKISRIINQSSGHALLVGVGGSGKQSLSRLSSFICQYSTVGIMISSTYGMNDLKGDLQTFYTKAGVKDEGLTFLFTEGQITNERFLVFINDLLSSGEIADLFPLEDVDQIVNNVRSAVKGEGIIDSKDNCWRFFIDRVKKNLHMSLCFSPVGEAFRGRARKFPALINSTVIDWFHPWPEDALLSVASKFLAEVEMATPEIREGIEKFMPYSFKIVNDMSQLILEQERRHVYTTPKSFLELIKLFKVMLAKKEGDIESNKEKYETGVIKLTETGEVVSKLEEELKVFSVEVEAKKKSADAQAEIVGKEKTKVQAQNDIAEVEAKKCAEIQVAVDAQLNSVQSDLDNALPLVEKAMKALDGLTIDDFRNLKALKTPPAAVANTFECVLHLLCRVVDEKMVPVDKKGNLKTEKPWSTSLSLMGNPGALLEILNSLKEKIDTDQIPSNNFKAIRGQLANPEFTPDIIRGKSACAAGLCDFIINITAYYDVVVTVEPKKKAVNEAKQKLAEANAKKQEMDELVARLNSELQILLDQYDAAMKEKEQAIQEADKCAKKLDLAQRLVNALGSELERWSQSIIDLGEQQTYIIGDVLLASAFVSYVGPFNKKFRDRIIVDEFINFFKTNNIPMNVIPDPLLTLTDEATIAGWNNCGLPPDQVSTENGAILCNSERYPLIIDPQLQGITWLRKTYEPQGLKITRLSNNKMVKTVELSVEAGNPVLIENLENSIDAVIQPVYSRAVIKRGKSRIIKMGDKELSLSPNFKLFLHSKLSNPHYPPEIQAECTIINFTVTELGLEDQLLSLVVKKERPDLAAQREELIQQQNGFKIKLKELENGLLFKLANAEGDILEDIELIESLEFSKKLSTEITEKVEIAKVTEVNINEASEFYRPAASRGALVFFLLNDLYKIHSFYKFSLDSFVIVVNRAIDIVADRLNPKKDKEKEEKAEGEEGEEGEDAEAEAEAEGEKTEEEEEEEVEMTPRTLGKRVDALTESITFQGFNYTRRGTLEAHKLIISTMLCFRILIRQGKLEQDEVDALIRKKVSDDAPHQADSLKFIPESAWGAVRGLESVPIFANLIQSMESEALQWRKWYGEEKPESVELPRAFKDTSLFHRILLLRAMRPDRLYNALVEFVSTNMGVDYTEQPAFDIKETYVETNPQTPIFFVLFPGVDPTPECEMIGRLNGKTMQDGNFIIISMGQGQEKIALDALTLAGKAGNWVMFQNVHLMQTWMKQFERQLEIVLDDDVHPEFRCFVSSEPPALPHMEIIPESILQNSLKVSNQAPSDLKSNLRRAFSKFDESHFERAKSHKLNDFKALLFGLCMFHSLILGRIKFGSQGWSRKYNFNDGDLTICGDILHNYLTKYEKVPYADLQYLYGQIMYGGHITDNWDRRTNETYLKILIRPQIMENMQLTLAQGFRSPDPNKNDRSKYSKIIEEKLPPESPQMFGLHSNAEIGYLTNVGETLFVTILQCSGGGGGGGSSKKDQEIKAKIDKFLLALEGKGFLMLELNERAKEKTPYQNVCLQECERMNTLLFTIVKSLEDLDAGLKGQLNMTDEMEDLGNCLFINMQPANWVKYAYASKKDLNSWFEDLLLRVTQLEEFSEDMITPKSLWISGLFNPMSFLTAIMQVTARRDGLPLDDMNLQTDVTNTINHQDIQEPPENGAYVHGYYLEGAGWELGRGGDQGYLTEMQLKELHPILPVVHVVSVQTKDVIKTAVYQCPVYVTTMRGGTFVFTAGLKMESDETDANLWILAGVALVQQPD